MCRDVLTYDFPRTPKIKVSVYCKETVNDRVCGGTMGTPGVK